MVEMPVIDLVSLHYEVSFSHQDALGKRAILEDGVPFPPPAQSPRHWHVY